MMEYAGPPRSQISSMNFGAAESPRYQQQLQQSGRGGYANSPLRGAGTAIGSASFGQFAGNSTRSSITSANFGGSGDPENFSARSTARFAGQATKSSISIANFGGDATERGEDAFRSSSLPSKRQSFQQEASFVPTIVSSMQNNNQSYMSPRPESFQPSSFGNDPYMDLAPANARYDSSIPSSGGDGALDAVVSPMIREIAELRVRNKELEDYVAILERKLAVYSQ